MNTPGICCKIKDVVREDYNETNITIESRNLIYKNKHRHKFSPRGGLGQTKNVAQKSLDFDDSNRTKSRE